MQIHHARTTATFTRENRPIQNLDVVASDIATLKSDVCDFIVEFWKENRDEYPGSSLYDLLSGLSVYLQREKNFDAKLMSEIFKEIRNTLDNVMWERAKEGVGANRPEHEFVSHEHEEILWSKGVLGESNPDQLRKTIFFLIGSRFGLCRRKEHHDLRRYPDSQINIIKVDGQDAFIYKEFVVKQGKGVWRIEIWSHQRYVMLFVQVVLIAALLNCIGNTCFIAHLVMAHGHAFMSKLILNGLEVLSIGILAGLLGKILLVNIWKR